MIKKILIVSLLFIITLFGQHITGSGTSGDPYMLYNAADFDSIRYLGLNNKYYKVANDIDFTLFGAVSEMPAHTTTSAFSLDGNNKTLSNLVVDVDNIGSEGLFNGNGSGSFTVKNLLFYNCSLTNTYTYDGGQFIGLLTGNMHVSGTITLENIHFDKCSVSITATNTGSTGDGTGGIGLLAGLVYNRGNQINISKIFVDSSYVLRDGHTETFSEAISTVIGQLNASTGMNNISQIGIKNSSIRFSCASVATGQGSIAGLLIGRIARTSVQPTTIFIQDVYSHSCSVYTSNGTTVDRGVSGGLIGISATTDINIQRVYSANQYILALFPGGFISGNMSIDAGDTITIVDSYFGEIDESYSPANLVGTFDFTSGWSTTSGVTIIDNNSFSTTGAGGIYKAITAGLPFEQRMISPSNYYVNFQGTSSTTPGLRASSGSNINTIRDGFGDGNVQWIDGTWSDYIYIRNSAAGTTNVDVLTVQRNDCFYYAPECDSIGTLSISGVFTNDIQGKTNAQLKVESTFSGWDFVNTWGINPTINDGYPYLLSGLTETLGRKIRPIIIKFP